MKRLLLRSLKLVLLFLLVIIALFLYSCTTTPEVREPPKGFASAFMPTNPQQTEGIELKIPWGYIMPNMTYQSPKEQLRIRREASFFRFVYGVKKHKTEPEPETENKLYDTTVYQLSTIYPSFEPRSKERIHLFLEGGNRVGIVVDSYHRADFMIDSLMHFSFHQRSINSTFDIAKGNVDSQALHYYVIEPFKIVLQEKWHTGYGLMRYGLSDADIQRLVDADYSDILFPNEVYYSRDTNGDLQRYMHCSTDDPRVDSVSKSCWHVFVIPEIQAVIKIRYKKKYLHDWVNIEQKTRDLFKRFVENAKTPVRNVPKD